jgi:hypothetical protein
MTSIGIIDEMKIIEALLITGQINMNDASYLRQAVLARADGESSEY